jgi:hypothetical protein
MATSQRASPRPNDVLRRLLRLRLRDRGNRGTGLRDTRSAALSNGPPKRGHYIDALAHHVVAV